MLAERNCTPTALAGFTEPAVAQEAAWAHGVVQDALELTAILLTQHSESWG